MDEVVWGRMPSERSHSFDRLRGSSLKCNMRIGNIIKVVSLTVIVVIVSLVIIFPVVKYTSTSSLKFQPSKLPNSSSEPQSCWSNVLSFGHDCTENKTDSISTDYNKSQSEVSAHIKNEHDKTNLNLLQTPNSIQSKTFHTVNSSVTEPREQTNARTGRSKWPYISTTRLQEKNDNQDFETRSSNIFAIPLYSSNDDELSKAKSGPDPYVFTPLTSFSNNYAQLLPYKKPTTYSNPEQILKYLQENKNGYDRISADSRNIKGQNTNTIVKVSGTYVMPLDRRRPGEIVVSKSGNSQDWNQPQDFNGHAYDPFMKYRPENLQEINKLIPVQTGFNIGPRFRKPVSFVPEASLHVDRKLPRATVHPQNSASHTVAIFHPPDSKPPLIKRPPIQYGEEKPLSVTLDIYPVTMDSEPGTWSAPPSMPNRDPGRGNLKMKPRHPNDRPRMRPLSPTSRNPPKGRPPASPTSDNHMIVHLNLYPSKRKAYTTISRDMEDKDTSLMNSARLLLSGGQFDERDSLDPNESSEVSETLESLTTTQSNETPNEHPVFSALTTQKERIKTNTSSSNITSASTSSTTEESEFNATMTYDVLDEPTTVYFRSATEQDELVALPNNTNVSPNNYLPNLETAEVIPHDLSHNASESSITTKDISNGLDNKTDNILDNTSYIEVTTVKTENSENNY